MVTRTFNETKVTLLCTDVENCEVYNEVVTLPLTYTDKDKALKAIKGFYDNNQRVAVKVLDMENVETLRAMYDNDFIEHSFILDPATRKKIETEETNN